jgi:hypothetical protein
MNIVHHTMEGHFKSKEDATNWIARRLREKYSVTTSPFKNPFAYSHEYPWEATVKKETRA